MSSPARKSRGALKKGGEEMPTDAALVRDLLAEMNRNLLELREENASLRQELNELRGERLSRAEATKRARIALAAKRAMYEVDAWIALCERKGWDPARIPTELKSELNLQSPNPLAGTRNEPSRAKNRSKKDES